MTAGVRLHVLGGFRLETAQGEPLSISLIEEVHEVLAPAAGQLAVPVATPAECRAGGLHRLDRPIEGDLDEADHYARLALDYDRINLSALHVLAILARKNGRGSATPWGRCLRSIP